MVKMTSGERLAVIETDIKYLKKQGESISIKLDAFIEAADLKYATKSELADIRSDVTRNSKNIFNIIRDYGPWILVISLFVADWIKNGGLL